MSSSSSEQQVTEQTVRHIALVTRREVIAGIPERWKAQYKRGAVWGAVMGGSSLAIHERLSALDPTTSSRQDVDAIIGNRSWTSINCDVCGADPDRAVVLCGGEYSERETTVCRECLVASLAALEAE